MGAFVLTLLLLVVLSFGSTPSDRCFSFLNAGDLKRAISAGKEAVKLQPRNVDALYCLGTAYELSGMLDLALKYLKKAESHTSSKSDLMHIYNRMGLAFSKKGDNDSALYYYMKSLSLAKDLRRTDMQSTLLNNIGVIYDNKGEYDKALRYYEMSIALKRDEESKATTYNNMAFIYLQKGDYAKAEEFFKKAIEAYELGGNYAGAGVAMLNLGSLYRLKKDYAKALKYISEGLTRVKKAGDLYWSATGYRYFGWLARDAGQYKIALESLQQAYELFSKIGASSSANSVKKDIQELKRLMRTSGKGS